MPRKPRPRQQRRVSFVIDAMDGLGQGIAQDGHSKCFIAKTLPGETGTATVRKQRKGVAFAAVDTLTHSAANRTPPTCEHFNDCGGCHFLHTDYASELRYKQAALARLCRHLPVDPEAITVLGAPSRLGYRNRIQLHYRHRYIGMVDGSSDRIQEIPHCKIIDPRLQPALDALYADKSWSKEHPGHGHCEIYARDGTVHTRWNQPYAQGGFTQVNDAMNDILREQLQRYAECGPAATMLELFAGQGNLSAPLVTAGTRQRVLVDYSGTTPPPALPNYHNLDLFAPDALAAFKRREPAHRFELMIVDPPRKGFASLDQWLRTVQPAQLIYVSCNAATMVRDLASIESNYVINDLCLIDLFPGTHHFETMARVTFNHKKTRNKATR